MAHVRSIRPAVQEMTNNPKTLSPSIDFQHTGCVQTITVLLNVLSKHYPQPLRTPNQKFDILQCPQLPHHRIEFLPQLDVEQRVGPRLDEYLQRDGFKLEPGLETP